MDLKAFERIANEYPQPYETIIDEAEKQTLMENLPEISKIVSELTQKLHKSRK